jgi:hypothetical protein
VRRRATLRVACLGLDHLLCVVAHPTIRREVANRFGVLPNFFCSAEAAPGLVEELWKFAKSAYLDSPLPSLFKERLFVHLSRFCEVRYCIVRHVGFLIGQGRPAGDANAGSETVEQVIEMLRRPVPEGAALAQVLERMERVSLGRRLPEPRTECETDLFDALTIMFLSPRDTARVRVAVRAAVGDATFELLVAYLAFIRTAHYWTEMHPELTYEPDMAKILREYDELADLLLDKSEAERVQGGVRLRETSIISNAWRWRFWRANHDTRFFSGLPMPCGRSSTRWRSRKRPAGFSASDC